ncbi:hypothetical protein GLN57_26615 [Shigella flexneri 2a]|nr:hypothetical protein [Shigella flexneri 2a]
MTYTGCHPCTHQKIIYMAINCVLCRDSSLIIGVVLNNVLSQLKKSVISR